VPPVPEIDADPATPPVERRQRLAHGALIVVLLLVVGVGVTALRDWPVRPGIEPRLQRDFDEFHLEDRFRLVSEDAGGTPAGSTGGEAKLVRVYRTSAEPQEAAAQLRSALRAAGVAATAWTGPAGLQLVSTSDLQERGRQVSAAVTVDRAFPDEPTTIRVVLSDWA
jgi:hypothetical protein